MFGLQSSDCCKSSIAGLHLWHEMVEQVGNNTFAFPTVARPNSLDIDVLA